MATIKTITTVAIILAATLLLSGTQVGAETDYGSMTTAELGSVRGTLRDASVDEREAFRSEWQTRMSSMTREERREYTGRPENALRDGSGLKAGQSNAAGGGTSGMASQRGMGRGRR